jgi:hypothetical protein
MSEYVFHLDPEVVDPLNGASHAELVGSAGVPSLKPSAECVIEPLPDTLPFADWDLQRQIEESLPDEGVLFNPYHPTVVGHLDTQTDAEVENLGC